jgi:MFS family permease
MQENQAQYPPSSSANYVLFVMLIAYILSFIDRNIMSVLVGPVREYFDITDFQFSLLHGMAFTLFYIFLGLPIGWMADRYSRKWIITTGVFFWSLMTCLCGTVKSFGGFFTTRIGVGVGEASLSPSAYSILGDYFPPQKLRWATSVFAIGITLGSGLSYKVGSWMYQWLGEQDFSGIPIIENLEAWQLTFIGVGLPGFIVVLLMLFVREPKRIATSEIDKAPDIPVSELIKYLRTHWQVYGAILIGIGMMAIVGYGTLVWNVEFLMRTYDITRLSAGSTMGNIFIIGGTAGTFAGAVFAGWLQKRGYTDANLRVMFIAALILVIPAAAAPLMPTADLAISLTWLVVFVHYTHFGVAMAAMQIVTPSRMRAQVSALLLFTTNFFGLMLGGSAIAFFTDYIFGNDDQLRYSLSLTAIVFYPIAAILVGLALKHYRTLLATMTFEQK